MHHGSFIHDLAVVMIVAGLVTILFHRFKQPVVLGYLLAGLIIGPHTPPYALVDDKHTIETLAELGVIFLMFSLGLHFRLKKLREVGATAFIAATLEIVFMIGIGYALGRGFGWGTMDSLFLGAILSISSTTIIIKALEELGLTRAKFAELIFGILIVEDILAIAMLALLSGVATTGTLSVWSVLVTMGELTVFLVAVLVFGLLLVPRLLRYVAGFKSPEMLLVTALGLCFGVSLLAVKLEYSVALGAFIIGAVIAESRESARISQLVEPVRDMFSAIFFVAIGMLIQPSMLLEYAGPILAITAAVVVGKVVTCSFGTLVAGNDLRTSMRVGMGLAQIGEFSFIIASLGLTLGVTSTFLYPIAVTVSAITTLLTPYLIKGSDPLIEGFTRLAPQSLLNYLEVYQQSLQGVSRDARHELGRKLLRRAVLQMALNVALITGAFIVANWYAKHPLVMAVELPTWVGELDTLVWLGAVLLVLPLVVATFNKLQGVGVLLAELATLDAPATRRVDTVRVVLANTILLAGMAALMAWMLVISSALLPPWPVLLALLGVVGVIIRVLKRPFTQLYSTAQVSLQETLSQNHEGHEGGHGGHLAEAERPVLPPMLADARLETIEIPTGVEAVGRLIRELALRSRTGASVVGIERQGTAIVNPSPDEELLEGDRVLLIGGQGQIQAATQLLTGARVG
ncbi:MAG: cation:proton antiporter [Myxococcota bacterium]